jgi:hypothetical protein
LTYMSMPALISAAVRDGRLFWVDPIFQSDPVVRRLLVVPEIWELIDKPPAAYRDRCARLRADLESFVLGHEIVVCEHPFEAHKKNAYMALLDPEWDGVWDIRSRDPSPALRVIGHFADQDLFVATVIASRSRPFPPVVRGPLGEARSEEWAEAIAAANSAWSELFGQQKQAFRGNITDVLSGNYRLDREE